MNTFTFHTPTLETLADVYALHTDAADAEQRLSQLRGRLAQGKTALTNFVILRAEQGVVAVAVISDNAEVPLFPRFRAGSDAGAMTVMAGNLLRRVGAGRRLILQEAEAPLNRAAIEAAGWVYDSGQDSEPNQGSGDSSPAAGRQMQFHKVGP